MILNVNLQYRSANLKNFIQITIILVFCCFFFCIIFTYNLLEKFTLFVLALLQVKEIHPITMPNRFVTILIPVSIVVVQFWSSVESMFRSYYSFKILTNSELIFAFIFILRLYSIWILQHNR